MAKQELGPEATRRRQLRRFVLTEQDIKRFKKLDPEEARWLIEHEHQIQTQWLIDRRDFLRTEVFGVSNPSAVESEDSDGRSLHVVQPRSTQATSVSGSRLG